ncbi:DUF5677 domain-containing protein [Salidesulfovibrio brasiliensis]|uniref:DUF5677 domain-containing protein n=1 Tax=Salidesulfovibrio brasiliensis TaxID=221711 RepID=UPI0006D22E01|nr:DUF5677 domain-containing protein [Salidesulfovibrio brasiliensis]
MHHDLPSCRKLIIDLKHEVQKGYAWLNTLNRLPHTPKTALVWAHLASFIQTAQAVITCAKHDQYVALPPLLRTAGECAVNCTLVLEQCSDDNALMAAWMEKRKNTNRITNQLRKEYSQGQIDTAEDYKTQLDQKLEEAGDSDETYAGWKVERRWSHVGQSKLYHTCYSMLSGEVHCNPAALDIRHAAEIDGQPTLIWCKHEVEEAQILLGTMFIFLEIAEPCFVALSDALAPDEE